MPWLYAQHSGYLYRPDGSLASRVGYAGFLMGRNNPSAQDEENIGPIPTGLYLIGKPYNEHGNQFVMDLDRLFSSSIHRGGFQIHGDNKEHLGFASHGCIIVGPTIRAEIAASTERLLEVRSY